MSIKLRLRREVWIGLVGVQPLAGRRFFKDAAGAYVNVLAWAANASEYRARVRQALKQDGLKVEEIEEAESFKSRVRLEFRCHNTISW